MVSVHSFNMHILIQTRVSTVTVSSYFHLIWGAGGVMLYKIRCKARCSFCTALASKISKRVGSDSCCTVSIERLTFLPLPSSFILAKLSFQAFNTRQTQYKQYVDEP